MSTSPAGAAGKQQIVTMVMKNLSDSTSNIAASGAMHTMEGQASTGFMPPGAEVNGNAFFFSSGAKSNAKKESLGKQVVEGVECVGSKEIATIPAGSVGNDRPIETVTERWYSPELQMEVLTKTTDPRFGETTYRLGNLVRAEQPKSLFEVPADYKLEDTVVNYKAMKSEGK
jgi:hypothetical protein